MAADAFIQCRVTAATKQALRTVADRQQLTQSALLKRLVYFAVQGVVTGQTVKPATVVSRDARLYVRLRGSDHRLLRERSAARQLAPATYVSLLVRSHLNGVAPLPQAELKALKESLSQLAILRRYVQTLAAIAIKDGKVTGPHRQEVVAMIKVLEILHGKFKSLLAANLNAWATGDGE